MHPTLAEVARKARVGTTTVSRVINGGERVSPHTLRRVQDAIDQLGYMPNQAARVLKGERARTVGLVIPSMADPFFASCAEAALAIARAHDSLLMVTVTHNDPGVELGNLNVLLQHRTDGILLAPANDQSDTLAELLERMATPVVTFDRPVSNSGIPCVLADSYSGARMATEHLIGHGYKRILCLGGEPALYTLRERLRGYSDAMKRRALAPLVDMSAEDYNSVERAIERLFAGSKPPEAIFALKNSTTIHVYETLQKLRVAIPRQVALLGYDDFELAGTLRPSISVVRQPIEEIGRIAAEILFEDLAARRPRSSRRPERGAEVKLETRLVLRQSCGCRDRGQT